MEATFSRLDVRPTDGLRLLPFDLVASGGANAALRAPGPVHPELVGKSWVAATFRRPTVGSATNGSSETLPPFPSFVCAHSSAITSAGRCFSVRVRTQSRRNIAATDSEEW